MNKFQESIYNISRNIAKNKLTGNLGKVIEEDDKLICYVDCRKCGKPSDFIYFVDCNGINDNNKELANQYKLNKKIYYVIDGIYFGRHLIYLFGFDNINVIIRNCKFPYGLHVSVDGDCLLENNHIKAIDERLMIGAYNITINDMYIYNEYKYTCGLDINIGADYELNIINSNIGRLREKTNVSLVAGDRLVLDNSDIRGNNVECKSKKIITHHGSCLISSEKVNINTNDFEPIKVTSPEIILNGNKVNSNGKEIVLKQLTNPLSLKRLELIELLKSVKDKCEMVNLEDSIKYEEELKNRTICKVLNKR